MPESTADLPIECLKGVGPRRARLLKTLGISTIHDALHYLPFRYQERSTLMPISSLMVGALCTAADTIVSLKSTRRNRGVNIFEVILHDGKGYLRVKWFNQPYTVTRIVTSEPFRTVCGASIEVEDLFAKAERA